MQRSQWDRLSSLSGDGLASVQGWVNHVRYGNTVGLRKALLGAAQSQAIATGIFLPLSSTASAVHSLACCR